MEEKQLLAARYREKGRTSRALALLMPEGHTRTVMTQCAEHYEKLAAFMMVGADTIYTGLERRSNFQLRAHVAEYEWQASVAREQAERVGNPEWRSKLISLADSLTEVADSLKGWRSKKS